MKMRINFIFDSCTRIKKLFNQSMFHGEGVNV